MSFVSVRGLPVFIFMYRKKQKHNIKSMTKKALQCSIFGLAMAFFCNTGVALAATGNVMTAKDVLVHINKERIKIGLNPLVMNAKLQIAAEDKAFDMVTRSYFSHNDPDGVAPWQWVESVSYKYTHAGENLAIGFISAEKQHSAWMNSDFHRRNILNSNYNDTGIAIVNGVIRGSDEFVVVQFFGRKDIPVVAIDVKPSVRGAHAQTSAPQAVHIGTHNALDLSAYTLTLFARSVSLEIVKKVSAIMLVFAQSIVSLSVAVHAYTRVYKRKKEASLA